ncbi:peptidylprolyl isomerase [Flavobacterium cyanobacteriorum]|uniref:Peptidylprolyl isomerase n=1 Tax=Flavobacterium cyanobacteriorum TaxID=2022802 RepID=A0A255Z9V5_9FLAO|nr:peptidylprolyl isomerase [Flavobacterium cyanobacteriorum]OYQ37645.1 peptidylprolyl isomerase [Flavobacterium cyanobacteriorum]
MKLKQALLGISLFILAASFAQQAKKEVLFTIDGKPYYTDEFIRVYNKNLDLVKDDSQKDLNNYLDLFIGYKLKVNKAYKLGLQEGAQYKAELKSYRNQLSRNYLTDTKVTKELIDEAYTRSLKEIKAQHILVLVDENALPSDTLKAYNKIIDIRKKALAGEDFGALAAQFSEDPSAKENKGDLGYFSVFRMVYPFETGAYKTPMGQISKPVRTRFGYHLIKVNDMRDNRGEITVAHIMIMKPKEGDTQAEEKARETINDIYQKLKQGEDFSSLATQFSQDKSSAANGGQLARFGSGELSAVEFEDAAFALQKPGDITAPFQTQFGWHIVKLVEKHGVKPQADVQADFENRIRRDDRSRLITASLNEKLRKKYTVKKEAKAYANAVKVIDNNIYSQTWKAPKEGFDETILTINNHKKLSAQTYLDYVAAQQRMELTTKPVARLAEVLFNQFRDDQLNLYYNENLEAEFPEFAIVMEEYRDGLLLFDLMEKEIWEKAKTDTLGLENYYKAHKDNYQWKDRVEADVYSSTKEDVIKQARKLLKQGKNAEVIKQKLNKEGKVEVMEKSGTFEQESNALPKQQKWQEGLTDIIKEGGYYYVIRVKKVLPKGPKTFEETKGRVINDYQQYLESNWVGNLKQEFNVQVNKDVFENIKKQLNR